jgi:predicted phosphodiesterase
MPEVKALGEVKAPLLIFGGPYSNLQATQVMKAVAKERGIPPKNVFCTGDTVAYCGEPFETVELISEWGVHVVKGNCEESLSTNALDCGCGFEEGTTCSLLSVEWYRFASSQVSTEQKQWMELLPSRITLSCAGRSIVLIHGGLEQVNQFFFPSTPREVKAQELSKSGADVVIGGHSGIPFGETFEEGAWLNSGVIGMPANDGTRDGWYLLLETDDHGLKASWHRLKYEAEKTSQTMKEAGLCGGYQEALLSGLWPSMDVLPDHEKSLLGVPITLSEITL